VVKEKEVTIKEINSKKELCLTDIEKSKGGFKTFIEEATQKIEIQFQQTKDQISETTRDLVTKKEAYETVQKFQDTLQEKVVEYTESFNRVYDNVVKENSELQSRLKEQEKRLTDYEKRMNLMLEKIEDVTSRHGDISEKHQDVMSHKNNMEILSKSWWRRVKWFFVGKGYYEEECFNEVR
jgi:DNA repair exonuclease SbcCD ATPase subunit